MTTKARPISLCQLTLTAVLTALLIALPGAVRACDEQVTERKAGATHRFAGALRGMRVVTNARDRHAVSSREDDVRCASQSVSASMRDAAGRLKVDSTMAQAGNRRAEIKHNVAFTAFDGRRVAVRVGGKHAMTSSSAQRAAINIRPSWKVRGLAMHAALEQSWRQGGTPSSRAALTVGKQVQVHAAAKRDSAGYWREISATAQTARPVGPLGALSASARWKVDRERYALAVGAKLGRTTTVNIRHAGSLQNAQRASIGVAVGTRPLRNLRLDAQTQYGDGPSFGVRARYRF